MVNVYTIPFSYQVLFASVCVCVRVCVCVCACVCARARAACVCFQMCEQLIKGIVYPLAVESTQVLDLGHQKERVALV